MNIRGLVWLTRNQQSKRTKRHLPEPKTRDRVKMGIKRKRKILITFFILFGIWCISFITNTVSMEATKTLIEAGKERSFWMVFYNFILYYVCGGLLSLATYFLVEVFPVKYLTKPLQLTCIAAIITQIYGACGYLGMWNVTLYATSNIMLDHHYISLIAITIMQLLLFLNVWIDSYVGHINRIAGYFRVGHPSWMFAYPIKKGEK